MANLAKLYAAQKSADVDTMVSSAVDAAMKRIVSGVNVNVEEQKRNSERDKTAQIVAAVNSIAPAIKQALEEAVSGVLAELGKIEPLDDIKGMVKGIRIPDHSGHLAAIHEAITSISMPETDLKPVLKALEALSAKLDEEEEEEEKKWVFKVNRDEITKLIESVDVVEGDEE